MLSADLLRKVRHIEIATRKMVDDYMSGQYRSHFKGHGVQFSEHRQYVHGDDIRHIDWKVSARTRDILIKKYEEERELTVFLVVDNSGSEHFGSSTKLKSEIAAEVAGMLAYAASHTGDKVGALLFSGGVDLIIRPKKGKQHILRIIRDVLGHKTNTPGTDLRGALEAANRIMKHSGVVFVISDFWAEDYGVALKRLARRHDVLAITIDDPREKVMPPMGMIQLVNPEAPASSPLEDTIVDTSSYLFKNWFKDLLTKHNTELQSALRGSRAEHLKISTEDDYGEAVVRFFRTRSRRIKR